MSRFEPFEVVVQHDLADVPLAPPSRTSGVMEVFRRRYLLRLMVRREIHARYAGTGFGLAWSYLSPLTRFLTFYFVFGILLGREMGINAYAIHLFSGMVIANYFTESVNTGTRSLLNNRKVIGQMALPREMFPVVAMLVSLWHAIPQIIILTIACLAFGFFGSGPLWHPDLAGFAGAFLGLMIVMVLSTAMGLAFSCINVIFRDFQRIVQTFMSMVPFTVPMMYPFWIVATRFPGIWGEIYLWNPVAEAVLLMQRGFWYPSCSPNCSIDRNTGVEGAQFPPDLFERGFIILGVCLVLLVFGQMIFSKLEKRVPERL